MIRIHVRQFPNLLLVCIVSERAVWTIRHPLLFRFLSLAHIDAFLGRLIEYAYFEELCIYRAAEDIFKYTSTILHIAVAIEISKLLRYFRWIIRSRMIRLIEPSPFEPSHLHLDIRKDT